MEMDEFFGYKYNERNKYYFSDKHEYEENVQYWKDSIKKGYIEKESLLIDTHYRRWSKKTGTG